MLRGIRETFAGAGMIRGIVFNGSRKQNRLFLRRETGLQRPLFVRCVLLSTRNLTVRLHRTPRISANPFLRCVPFYSTSLRRGGRFSNGSFDLHRVTNRRQ